VAKVLIVDDSPVTRMIIGEFLSMSGHEVAGEAENLAEAVAAYAEKKPDLVTLDLSMGQDDGFAVLKALRAHDPKAKALPLTEIDPGLLTETDPPSRRTPLRR